MRSNKKALTERPFRSNLERLFANGLSVYQIKWEYEPRSFKVSVNGVACYWTPDFYLPDLNLYVEIGCQNFDGKKKRLKIKSFRKAYPLIRMLELSSKEIDRGYVYYVQVVLLNESRTQSP